MKKIVFSVASRATGRLQIKPSGSGDENAQPQDYAGKMNSHELLIMRSSMFNRSRSPKSPNLKLPITSPEYP